MCLTRLRVLLEQRAERLNSLEVAVLMVELLNEKVKGWFESMNCNLNP